VTRAAAAGLMESPAASQADLDARPGTDRLRVAICSAGELWGGVERFIIALATGLRERGHAPLVLLYHDGLLAERLRDGGFQTCVVDGGKYDPEQIRRTRRVLSDHGINLLHVHGYRATIVGGLASMGSPVRVVRTEHGRFEPLDDWRDIAGHARLAANQLMERAAARATVDATVFVSRELQAGVRAGQRPGLVRIIPNGLDPAGLDRVAAAPRDRPGFHVGIVGRIVKVKGHEPLLDAMGHLSHLPGMHLHVFGTGPLETHCAALAARRGLSGQVTFHGFCANMASQMRSLDVIAMPSLHEGLPYALLEALYLRVPVVASAVGGLREVIEDGRSGLLVPPEDPHALARSLERLYRDPDLRQRLGEGGHRRVRETFLAPRMVDDYVVLYREVIAG
jgi:glycosyltransferase involved in cell wall biosynthesis